MATVEPAGEELRKAVKWISEARQDEPGKKLSKLIEEACMKFDLTPVDAEFLQRTLKES
jgi:hypothetical protein